MKKKLLALLLTLVMVMVAVVALVACNPSGNNGDNGDGNDDVITYNITVWASEGSETLMRSQIAKFNETVGAELLVKFNATVETVSESKAVGDMEGKDGSSGDWPEIFCFAQDQLARAVKKGFLQTLNPTSVKAIEDNNTTETVEATKIGGTIRAFPMTADNGYFMYYDKSVINKYNADITSLESLIDACEKDGKMFSMPLTQDAAWYAASFFYATGCESTWETNDDGSFKTFNDTIKDDAGVKALQGMQKLLKSDKHNNSDKASDFNAGIPSAVVISGVWEYNTAKKALGDNLGVAPLPSFTIDGDATPYQLKSYLGYKFMGVTPQTDGLKSLYLQQLAMYLTNTACQQERFTQLGWGPADKTLTALTSDALTQLKVTATINQGQYPSDWWKAVDAMALSAKSAGSDASSLTAIINTYRGKLTTFLS